MDDNPAPGRFLITGSAPAQSDTALWPGTGRFVRVPLFGLTARERRGGIKGPGFLDRLLRDGPEDLI